MGLKAVVFDTDGNGLVVRMAESAKAAEAVVDAWIREWWVAEVGTPVPEKLTLEARTEYFDAAEERCEILDADKVAVDDDVIKGKPARASGRAVVLSKRERTLILSGLQEILAAKLNGSEEIVDLITKMWRNFKKEVVRA